MSKHKKGLKIFDVHEVLPFVTVLSFINDSYDNDGDDNDDDEDDATDDEDEDEDDGDDNNDDYNDEDDAPLVSKHNDCE